MNHLQVNLPHYSKVEPSDVRRALENLLYRANPLEEHSPLLYLRLLRPYISEADSLIWRVMALGDLLTTIISQVYSQHRQIRDLPSPDEAFSLRDATAQIQSDVLSDSVELMCWSWLFHRYVRVDLDIGPQQFATICGITDRTLRRYHQHGVRRLTEQLIRQEMELWRNGHDLI